MKLDTIQGGKTNWYYQRNFRSIYLGDTTNGEEVSILQGELIDFGLTTGRFFVLSWCCTTDMVALSRILKGNSGIVGTAGDFNLSCPSGDHVDNDTHVHYQPVKVNRILKSMLKDAERRSFGLRAVREALFPHATRRPDHTALEDVVAFQDVIAEIIRQADKLEQNERDVGAA